MSGAYEPARQPEDIARLVVERMRAGDAEGIAALYAPDAVLAFPPGRTTVGRDAIRAVYADLIAHAPAFRPERPLATIRYGDLALTSTHPLDGSGARAQVAQRQPDGTWLRIIDRPEFRDEPPAGGDRS